MRHFFGGVLGVAAFASTALAQNTPPTPVNVHNFIRAETDLYFRKAAVDDGAFGKLRHRRAMASIDKQDVVRMNRDTLYSSGVFDLDASPLTITLPDAGERFMSMQIISQDHYTTEVAYGPGTFTYDKDKVGTRYAYVIIRTLADPGNPQDVTAANAMQDAIKVAQATPASSMCRTGTRPHRPRREMRWKPSAHSAAVVNKFGRKDEVDPLDHLIGTASGWGGNPRSAANYHSFHPPKNDGRTVYRVTLKDVPVDGFWSISVYNAKGFFVRNALGAYSLNNLSAKPDADGGYTIQFGGCRKETPNCLPIMKGWNYTMRFYRPRKEILDGSWKFPEAQPVL